MPRIAIALAAVVALVGLGVFLASRQRGGGEVRAKVDACVAVQRDVAQRRATRGRAPPGELSDAAVVARGCAPLFSQAACRDAMMDFDGPPPEARSGALFVACTRAYCPSLAEPRPSACVREADDPSRMAEQWDELRTAVLKREIGDEETARVISAIR